MERSYRARSSKDQAFAAFLQSQGESTNIASNPGSALDVTSGKKPPSKRRKVAESANWTCESCTYLNEGGSRCEICRYKRRRKGPDTSQPNTQETANSDKVDPLIRDKNGDQNYESKGTKALARSVESTASPSHEKLPPITEQPVDATPNSDNSIDNGSSCNLAVSSVQRSQVVTLPREAGTPVATAPTAVDSRGSHTIATAPTQVDNTPVAAVGPTQVYSELPTQVTAGPTPTQPYSPTPRSVSPKADPTNPTNTTNNEGPSSRRRERRTPVSTRSAMHSPIPLRGPATPPQSVGCNEEAEPLQDQNATEGGATATSFPPLWLGRDTPSFPPLPTEYRPVVALSLGPVRDVSLSCWDGIPMLTLAHPRCVTLWTLHGGGASLKASWRIKGAEKDTREEVLSVLAGDDTASLLVATWAASEGHLLRVLQLQGESELLEVGAMRFDGNPEAFSNNGSSNGSSNSGSSSSSSSISSSSSSSSSSSRRSNCGFMSPNPAAARSLEANIPTRLMSHGTFDVGGNTRRVAVWVAGGEAARVLLRHDYSGIKQVAGLSKTPARAHRNHGTKGNRGGVTDSTTVVDVEVLPGKPFLLLGLLDNPSAIVLWQLRKLQCLWILPLATAFSTLVALPPVSDPNVEWAIPASELAASTPPLPIDTSAWNTIAEGACQVREAARIYLTQRATGEVSAYRVVLAGGDKQPGQAHLIEVPGDIAMLTGDFDSSSAVDSSSKAITSGVLPSGSVSNVGAAIEPTTDCSAQPASCQLAVVGQCCVAWAHDGTLRCFDGDSSSAATLPVSTGALVSVTVRADLPLLVRRSSNGTVDVFLAGGGEEQEPFPSSLTAQSQSQRY